MKNNNFYILIPFLIIASLLSSCRVERDIAREFVQQDNNIAILLLADSVLYKTNDKVKRIPDFDSMNFDMQDSIWAANSVYLDSVNDKKLINNLFSCLKNELEYYEFKIYTDKNKKDFEALNSGYIFKVSQVELEEDKYTYRDQYSFPNNDTLIYYKDHEINKYDLNCWFELTPKDTTTEKKRLFYNSFSIEDKLDGSFFKNASNTVKYKYHIFLVSLNDIYYLSTHSGNKNSNFLFNYFMNMYIRENMPKGFNAEGYYSLDPVTGYIHVDDEENNDNSFYEIQ